MGYFDVAKNVEDYIKMAEGYDGALLISKLAHLAPPGARVLELGMGAGKDLRLLKEAGFDPIGSDYSNVFVERYRSTDGEFPVHHLDARTLEIGETFDVIYSNKVLHSLSEDDLTISLTRQMALLDKGGVLLHSFWLGEGNEVFQGMFAQYYSRESFHQVLPAGLECVEFQAYQEMEPGDSFWAALKRSADHVPPATAGLGSELGSD